MRGCATCHANPPACPVWRPGGPCSTMRGSACLDVARAARVLASSEACPGCGPEIGCREQRRWGGCGGSVGAGWLVVGTGPVAGAAELMLPLGWVV